MAKPRNPRKDTDSDNDYTPFDGCMSCRDPEPHARHRHYLALAREYSLDEVERHVLDEFMRKLAADPERARDAARDVKLWLLGFITRFSGMADEDTGAPLAWYEAMKLNARDMAETYETLAEEGREAEAKQGGWRRPSEPWQPITWDEMTHRRATTMRERRERREGRRQQAPVPETPAHPLDYHPTTDPAMAKALLRRQLEQLKRDEERRDATT